MVKWFTYDPDLVQNNYETRFKNWVGKWTQTVLHTFRSKEKFGLQNQDHFRYLQISDFTSKKFPRAVPSGRDEENVTVQKITSKLYSVLQHLKIDHTLDIKGRWEAEGGFTVLQEEWERLVDSSGR